MAEATNQAIEVASIESWELDPTDADSTWGGGGAPSTFSITSSILEYRNYKGRRYHSSIHDSSYFVPTDEQTLDNFDVMYWAYSRPMPEIIEHHFLTLLLDDRLHLAPIKKDAQNVLDIGTGTGIWAIDFAEENPHIAVVGTDLSPIQPNWVLPNLKFEIDDCTKTWTREADTFDFVHIRYLFGAIRDWTALFREAYRVVKPGAYLESVESEPTITSDDGTVTNDGKTLLGGKFSNMFAEAGRITGNSLTVLTEGLQVKAMREAGFVDVQERTYKVPFGWWPRDQKLARIGQFAKMSLESDLSGYTQLLWHEVLRWPAQEFELFLMQLRRELRDNSLHPYFRVRYVWGRKP